MAKGIRALLDTVMQALPQVGNLGLLFFLLFFIFAALGVELFGRLECTEDIPCQGLGEHAHFSNFGMAFLTLFRVATGDNWNGIMKDTLRDDCDDSTDCVKNCCVSSIIAPIFFVIFVLLAQFVLVNVVIAVLMKHLEESHKQMEDELDMEMQLERELAAEQDELLELAEEEPDENDVRLVESDDDEFDGTIDKNVLVKIRQEGFRRYDNYDLKRIRKFHEEYVKDRSFYSYRPGLSKVRSLPSSFVYNPPSERQIFTEDSLNSITRRQDRRRSSSHRGSRQQNVKLKRRQTFHTQKRGTLLTNVSHFEFKEIRKPLSNLSVPVIIFQKSSSPYGSKYFSHPSSDTESHKKFKPTVQVNKKSANTTNDATRLSFDVPSSSSEKSSIYLLGVSNSPDALHLTAKSRRPDIKEKTKMEVEQDLDVHSVINERRPSKFKINQNSNKNYPDNNQQFSSSQGTNIDESSAVSKMANDNLNDATRSISDLAIQELDKLICKPVRNLEAEIKIYVDEDVEDSSIESTDIRKSISIVVDTSEYVENEGCTT